MPYKAIAGLAPLGQSIAIASQGMKMAKNGKKSDKKRLKEMVGGSTNILVGIPLMRATAAQVAAL